MPKEITPQDQKTFINDGTLYMLWKFANARRLVPRNNLYFRDFIPCDYGNYFVATSLLECLKDLDIELDGMFFNKDAFVDYEMTVSHDVWVMMDSEASPQEKISLDAIYDNKFTAQDVQNSWRSLKDYDIDRHIGFPNNLSEVKANKIKTFIDMYMSKFLDNSLGIKDRNYFKFEKQISITLDALKRKEESYGNQFIINYPNKPGVEPSEAYLFIHALISLERDGYLTVQKIHTVDIDLDLDPDSQGYNYKVMLVLNDKFYEETKPKSKFVEPVMQSFNDKKGIIKFAGEEIELSKSGKETDSVLLVKSLLGANVEEWKHNDEILSDWDYTEADIKRLPKNKIYHAGLKVNDAIAKRTKIEDFIELSTTKARINPKYRKSES